MLVRLGLKKNWAENAADNVLFCNGFMILSGLEAEEARAAQSHLKGEFGVDSTVEEAP